VGRYRLAARLGSGGMGRVYLGFSPAGRAVAVKVIRPELARDHGFIRRFRREVAAARMVNGLYTATVVDAGADAPWLATAFVPGPSLAEVIEVRGPLAEDPVWRLAGGMVEALAAVHACGLVHRDLKPANVLLAVDGPRVIDFGVSLALEGTVLTGTGLAVGTPGFMSPEQADGDRAGPASDVFALGSVLTYAATGTGPFGDGQPAAVLYRIVHAQPTLDGVPGPLRDLVAACLARDPSGRPTLAALMDTVTARPVPAPASSAVSFWPPDLTEFIGSYQAGLAIPLPSPPAEIADASSRPAPAHPPTQAAIHHPRGGGQPTVTGHHPSPAPAPPAESPPAPARLRGHPAQRRRRRRVAFALGVLCAIGVTAVVLASQLPHPTRVGDGGTSAPRHQSTAGSVTISATLVRTLTDPGIRGITPATHVTAVAFSPDGKTLATGYDSDGGPGYVYLWNPATGHRTATLEDLGSGGVTAMAFSPGGKILATGDYDLRTYLWDAATGHRTAILAEPESSGVTAVAFSPDGKTLVTGDNRGGTYLWDTATGHRTASLTAPGSPPVTALAFSPDGKILAIGEGSSGTSLWDTASWHRTATLTGPGSPGVTTVAFSPDSRTLAAGDGGGDSFVWDTSTRLVTATLTEPGSAPVTAVAFSPDGKTLATGDGDGNTCLWDATTGSRAAVLVSPGSAPVTAVAFSPDGKTLATGDDSLSTYLWDIHAG